MLEYLIKVPQPSNGFKLMSDWDNVISTALDLEARQLFINEDKTCCNLREINKRQSKVHLLTFLRYDYKKILIRNRYLYFDRIFDLKTGKLKGADLDYAFFEPILLCFPTLELLGRINFPDVYKFPGKGNNTTGVLQSILEQMGGGYNKYAKDLVNWHRNALSHELRPDGHWVYDLNTEKLYGSPQLLSGEALYLNIPHFIDSCIFEIERLCNALTSPEAEKVMKNFAQYISKRFDDN